MRAGARGAAVSLMVAGVVLLTVAVRAQAPSDTPPMAEDVFKNVQVLKGIPVNDFMGTMGIFSAA